MIPWVVLGTNSVCRAQESADEFFENRIRPVLVEHCYQCHNSLDSTEGELALDWAGAMRAGGAGGEVLDASSPTNSRLLKVMRHEIAGLEMPQDAAKLSSAVLDDFETWLRNGAIDPRTEPPSAEELQRTLSWDAIFNRRKGWWCWQPIQESKAPQVEDVLWNSHPIDRFIWSLLREQRLNPSTRADEWTLVRRLWFNLLGLPPTVAELEHWTSYLSSSQSESSREKRWNELIEFLLSQDAFGERWARHWMDWIRYAESHGSEGDPRIVGAWQYRDYLIRAFNADVPLNQLVLEHIAGDQLQQPRINAKLGINESAIGPAHWRMVFHGFAPTDAMEERVRFTDDQINVFGKAFLGLTLSCARCHDHKFDAISQDDYYALFGMLVAERPGRQVVDVASEIENQFLSEMSSLKESIRRSLVEDWTQQVESEDFSSQVVALAGQPEGKEDSLWLSELKRKLRNQVSKSTSDDIPDSRDSFSASELELINWNLSQSVNYASWTASGKGLPDRSQPPGGFAIEPTGPRMLTGIYPAGVFTHTLSQKLPGRLTSPDFVVKEGTELWLEVIGDPEASLRYVVQDYPRNGTVYPVAKLTNAWRWQKFDVGYWAKDRVHLELACSQDAPLLAGNAPRSWFGIRQAKLVRAGYQSPTNEEADIGRWWIELMKRESADGIAKEFQGSILDALASWQEDRATDLQAYLLDESLRVGLLSNQLEQHPNVRELIRKYRELESQLTVPTRVPGLETTEAVDQPIFIRGNHNLPGETVKSHFISAIDPKAFDQSTPLRMQLAHSLVGDANPLTRRVLVNRIWYHLFGRGLVPTVDNFGQLGEEPSHPELLDYLATQLLEQGWSIKDLIRLIVSSRTWQLSSVPTHEATERDPDNKYFSHANLRRMEAEAIRDYLLATSGRLEPKMYGPSVSGAESRRSIYVEVIRNSLDPLLRTFDFPEPFSTMGRRDQTNVPAQSLTLMNDPQISDWASAWAEHIVTDRSLRTSHDRVLHMFETAVQRVPTDNEIAQITSYVDQGYETSRSVLTSRATISQQLGSLQKSRETLLAVIREKVEVAPAEPLPSDFPIPLYHWDFSDNVGSSELDLIGEARISDGSLLVSERGYAQSKPLPSDLTAKTLVAWVQLSNLSQRGGGVLSVQTPDGAVFDALVFGEQAPQQWLAGSNNFLRTRPFGGVDEQEAVDGPVQLAITYDTNGRIAGFRNGVVYGGEYTAASINKFAAGKAVVTLGVRHLPATGNRNLNGRIVRATVYDVALSAEQIQQLYSSSPLSQLSIAQFVDRMDVDTQAQYKYLNGEVSKLERQLNDLPQLEADGLEREVWSDVARLLFQLKEFIYVP